MWLVLLIISIIIVLLGILLLLNVSVSISYTKEEKHLITLKIGFIKIKIYPKNKNKQENHKEKNKNTNDDTKEEIHTEESTTTDANAVEKQSKKMSITFSEILKIISYVRYRLTIYDISINMNVGIIDAAHTAILCGGLYANLYATIGLFQNVVFIKPPSIKVNPVYNELALNAEYFISVKIRIISALIALFKIYKLIRKDK